MTANDVNVVIDNIASKLGLAASGMADFVPELARYAIAQDIIAAVISAVVLLVAVLAVRWSIKNPPKDSLDWESPSPFARWFGTIGGIVVGKGIEPIGYGIFIRGYRNPFGRGNIIQQEARPLSPQERAVGLLARRTAMQPRRLGRHGLGYVAGRNAGSFQRIAQKNAV